MYVVSTDLKEKLESIANGVARKVEIIPMGVDCAAYSPASPKPERGCESPTEVACDPNGWPAGRLKVLFIGRLTQIKGAELLIRAASGLPAIDLTIAGDGDLRASLGALARELGVQVRFTGQVDRVEKRRLLADCDVVVIPSILLNSEKVEGLPVVLLEAMAAAKPIVASRCGGLTDVILEGENGLLFDPGDQELLASRLRELHSEPAKRRRLGDCAAISALQYDWSVIGERFRRSIRQAL